MSIYQSSHFKQEVYRILDQYGARHMADFIVPRQEVIKLYEFACGGVACLEDHETPSYWSIRFLGFPQNSDMYNALKREFEALKDEIENS